MINFSLDMERRRNMNKKKKDKAKSPDNGDNIIIKSEEFEVEVPDGYEITTAGRLAFDMRITSQEPDWED